MLFEVDTGAEVTAILWEVWQTLGKPALQTPDKKPAWTFSKALGNTGRIPLSPHQHRKVHYATSISFKHPMHNLLGHPAITALKLAVKMDSVETQPTVSWQRKFLKVFQGLRTQSGEYNIKLCSDAKPHALFTPRNVPLPLHPKVREELEMIKKAGVISKESKTTR